MISIDILLDGDGAWPDMIGCQEGKLEAIARLQLGMANGSSSVAFRILLPDGKRIIVQTSMKLFLGAAGIMKAEEEHDGKT